MNCKCSRPLVERKRVTSWGEEYKAMTCEQCGELMLDCICEKRVV